VYAWATGRVELNILLTLGIGVQLVLAVEALRRRYSAAGVVWLMVVVGASLACDYRLTGPVLVLLFHEWFARPGRDTALLVVVGVAAVNGSLFFAPAALGALVVAVGVAWWAPRVPRVTRHWFYPFYPAHLALIRWLGAG
jgi:hypothetical protein